MSELLLTSSLDPIQEGDLFPKGVPLPRHVTVWQHFKLPEVHENAFIDDIGAVVEGFSPLEVVGAERDKFGPDNDVLVRRVIALGRTGLLSLHAVTGAVIERYDGVVRNPEWAYENYNPHVTYVNKQAIGRYEYAKLQTLELVKKEPDTGAKVIHKVWNFEEL